MFDKTLFQKPSDEFAPVPFWFWNDGLEEKEIAYELKEMASQGIHEAIIHARKGLSVPYLSEGWFEKIGFALKTAEALHMRLWIYDEDNWPSGYAGGKVLESDPDFAAKCLTMEKIYPVLGKPVIVSEKEGSEIVSVVAVYQDKEFVDITDFGKNGKEPWHSETLSWEVFVFRMERCGHCPAYSSLPYVDLLNTEATKRFVEVTHKEYQRRFPSYFGTTIKGFFTDEPGFYENYLEQAKNLNTIIWTRRFPERFLSFYGYDIRPYLPVLWQDMALSSKIRKDYYDAVSRFYRESYFDVLSSFLKQYGLLSIGHLHREERLEWQVKGEADFFKAIDGLDYSGIDCIDRGFPRVTEKLASSASDLLRKERTLSETFGCFGWGLTPQEMKERIDFQYVQGINMMVLHAFFSSIDGFRKKESPPSLFYQNAYWPSFHLLSDYTARLSYALSIGEHLPKVALYYPSLLAQRLYKPLDTYEVKVIDECLLRLTKALLLSGVDFEFVPESFLSNGRIEGASLCIGKRRFEALLLPCAPDSDISQMVSSFAKRGRCYELGESQKVPSSSFYPYFNEGALVRSLKKEIETGFDGENVISYRRDEQNESLLFLLNYLKEGNEISLLVPSNMDVELWDASEGEGFLLFGGKENPSKERLCFQGKEAMLLRFVPKGSSLPKRNEKPFRKEPLAFASARFNDVSYPETSAHLNNLHSFDGEVALSYSFEGKKGEETHILFEGVKDFGTLLINGKEVGSALFAPFEFDVSKDVMDGENAVVFKIHNTKSNAFEGTDLDAGLIGGAFVLRR